MRTGAAIPVLAVLVLLAAAALARPATATAAASACVVTAQPLGSLLVGDSSPAGVGAGSCSAGFSFLQRNTSADGLVRGVLSMSPREGPAAAPIQRGGGAARSVAEGFSTAALGSQSLLSSSREKAVRWLDNEAYAVSDHIQASPLVYETGYLVDDMSMGKRLELHIPRSLETIHDGPQGPLGKFIDTVRDQFCQAVGVPLERLKVLGVRGEDVAFGTTGVRNNTMVSILLQAGPRVGALMQESSSRSTVKGPVSTCWWRKSRCSIVDLEALQRSNISEPTTSAIIEAWEDQLGEPQSYLMRGPLSQILRRATLSAARCSMPVGVGVAMMVWITFWIAGLM